MNRLSYYLPLLFLCNIMYSQEKIITLYPTDDAFVASELPDNVFNGGGLLAGRESNGENYVTLIKYDLSEIPNNVIIEEAQLLLYIRNNSGVTTGRLMELEPTPWDESTVTYNTGPYSGTGDIKILFNVPNSESFCVVDVIDLVKLWHKNGTNNGFHIWTEGAQNGDMFLMADKENSGTTYDPQLVIKYRDNHDIFISNALVVQPMNLYPGDEITVTCDQNYDGTSSSRLYSNVGYYLSNDNTCSTTDDILLGEDESSLSSTDLSESEEAILKIPYDIINPGEYYICIIGNHDDQIIEENKSNNAVASKINIKVNATEVGNLSPPYSSATKEHKDFEVVSIWGRRYGSAPSEYDAESGKIHHRSIVGANLFGGTNYYVSDLLEFPISVNEAGYYRITFKGTINGSILAGRVSEIGHCSHYLAVSAGVYGIGAAKEELRNTLDEEWPTSLKYIAVESAKVIVSILFGDTWVSTALKVAETISMIQEISEQLQQLRFYSNEDIGNNGLVVEGYLEKGTHNAILLLYSHNIAGVSAGVVTSIIDVTAQLDNVIIEKLGGEIPQIPNAPTLLSPQNQETDLSINPVLTWNSAENATSYHLQISNSFDFSNVIINQKGLLDTYYETKNLQYNTDYFWRISATNKAGTGTYSAIRSFKTLQDIPEIPTLSSPSNNIADVEMPITLRWNTVLGATTYTIEISKQSDFSSIEIKEEGIVSDNISISNLNPNTKYYWRCKSINASGSSSWSELWNFSTRSEPVPPIAAVDPNPLSGATDQPLEVNLSWSNGGGLTSYKVYFGSDSSPDDGEYLGTTMNTNYSLSTLDYNTKYYWRIDAVNDAGETTGTVWDFTTIPKETKAWSDGFETYSANTFPSNWTPDANANQLSSSYVDNTVSRTGNQSLKLYGNVGGCWGALGYRAINVDQPFVVQVAVRNGDESLFGCHPDRGQLGLRQGTNWSNPARTFISFKGDGTIISGGGSELMDAYNPLEWYVIKVRYEKLSLTEVSLSYWINDNYIRSETLPTIDAEDLLNNLEFTVQEGTAWFDDVSISQEEITVLTVSAEALTLEFLESSTTTFDITSNTNWTVTSSELWLKASENDGEGDGMITLTAEENTAITSRTGIITVSGDDVADQTISVTQEPGKPYLNATPDTLIIPSATSSQATFNIESNSSWSLACSDSWLKASTYSGSGNSLIILNVDANSSVEARVAFATILSEGVDDRTVSVFQAGIPISASHENANSIGIYPNPAKDKLRISGLTKPMVVKIYNVNGKLLYLSTLLGADSEINVSGLISGLYFIELESKNDIITGRFVIE